MKLVTISLSSLLCCATVQANTNFGTQKITSVMVHDSGNLLVKLEESNHSENCADSAVRNVLVLNPSSQHLDKMYSTALAAFMAGRQLSGWANGCVSIYGKNFPKATRISVEAE